MTPATFGAIAFLSLALAAGAADIPRPAGGDHAWMTYAALRALPAEDIAWLQPEVAPLISTYCHLPDVNWNNYGQFGGWSGLPDEPRTPDTRREWELSQFTGFNHMTGAGRRFGHAPPDVYEAVPWHLPRIVESLRDQRHLHGIIELGILAHYIQDSATFPHMQALHRAKHFDATGISIDGYEPQLLGEDLDPISAAATGRARQMVAWCDARAPELRAALQADDAGAESDIRCACANEASQLLADLWHSLIALVRPVGRAGPPPLDHNLAANPGFEEEDPGEALPLHWVVGYNDLSDRLGRALWEGKIIRNARMWHGGRRCAKLMWTPAAGLEWRQTWPSSIYVSPGEFYVASAWAKVYDGTGETQVVLAFYRDDLSPAQEFAGQSLEGRTDWQRLTVAAPVPEGAVRARVILRSVANEGAAWFDDVELRRVDEAQFELARQAQPEQDTLVLHLPFDTDVQDDSLFSGLNSPIASLSGTRRADLLDPDGRIRGCARFDGQDDFVEVPHSSIEDVLSPPGAMTIALWLKADRAGPAFICGKAREAEGKAYGYRLTLTETGQLEFAVAIGGAWTPAATAPIPLGEWVHVAAVRGEAGQMRLYVAGRPAEPLDRPGAYEPSTHSFYLGADHGVSAFYAGAIDDFRLYREALAEEDIRRLQ